MYWVIQLDIYIAGISCAPLQICQVHFACATFPLHSWLFFPNLQCRVYHCDIAQLGDMIMDMHQTMARGRREVVALGHLVSHRLFCRTQVSILQEMHVPGCVSVTALLHSADEAAPVSEPAADPQVGLWSTTELWCCRCKTGCGRFGNRWHRRGREEKVSSESGERLTTWGHGSHPKKCGEYNWSSKLSAPEFFFNC